MTDPKSVTSPGPTIVPGNPPVAQHLRAAEAAGLVAGVEPDVGQLLVVRELQARFRVLDVLVGAREIGAVRSARW